MMLDKHDRYRVYEFLHELKSGMPPTDYEIEYIHDVIAQINSLDFLAMRIDRIQKYTDLLGACTIYAMLYYRLYGDK